MYAIASFRYAYVHILVVDLLVVYMLFSVFIIFFKLNFEYYLP